MASRLHLVRDMNLLRVSITVIIALLPSLALAAPQDRPQGVNARGVVESAEITGIDDDEISKDLRDAVQKLVGQPFDQQTADDLVVQIQIAKPDFIATTRLLSGSQPDRVKVMFVLEKTDEKAGAESNVNSRYTVERVEIRDYDESRLSQSIRDEMKKLVGEKLDQAKASEIQRRIDDELRPRHYAVQKVVKGSDRQHIVLVYEIRGVRWIPFVDVPKQRFVYHSKQNFSIDLTVPINLGSNARLLFGGANDQDQLIERFAGFNVGFETTKVGTDRLGLALRYASYHDKWQPATGTTGIYRERTSFDPTVTFAFDPTFRLTAGVSLASLQIQYPEIHNDDANAVTASLNYRNNWGDRGKDRHFLEADYDFRSGTHNLDSDFIYTRHFVHAGYSYVHNRSALVLSFLGGAIGGNAPFFERFSLGDTTTLRGWNKFDVAPLGGNRVTHGTLQYGVSKPLGPGIDINGTRRSINLGLHAFYDVGAVGDSGSPIKVRHSVGFGFGSSDSSPFFIELGFPIRSSNVEPVFMMGFRW